MKPQFDFFDGAGYTRGTEQDLPEGFRYQPELIDRAEEEALLTHVRVLPFEEFEFHGYTGKRRVISFGWHYDFAGRRLRKADDIPGYLLALRETAASFAGMEAQEFQHVLVTEYGTGAGIGWHRDKAVFGQVVGISLLSPCLFRMRRLISKKKWERVNLIVQPRSAYLLSGPARYEWEHSIPQTEALRYSITFRNVRIPLFCPSPFELLTEDKVAHNVPLQPPAGRRRAELRISPSGEQCHEPLDTADVRRVGCKYLLGAPILDGPIFCSVPERCRGLPYDDR